MDITILRKSILFNKTFQACLLMAIIGYLIVAIFSWYLMNTYKIHIRTDFIHWIITDLFLITVLGHMLIVLKVFIGISVTNSDGSPLNIKNDIKKVMSFNFVVLKGRTAYIIGVFILLILLISLLSLVDNFISLMKTLIEYL